MFWQAETLRLFRNNEFNKNLLSVDNSSSKQYNDSLTHPHAHAHTALVSCPSYVPEKVT